MKRTNLTGYSGAVTGAEAADAALAGKQSATAVTRAPLNSRTDKKGADSSAPFSTNEAGLLARTFGICSRRGLGGRFFEIRTRLVCHVSDRAHDFHIGEIRIAAARGHLTDTLDCILREVVKPFAK